MLGAAELCAVFQVASHKSTVDGENHLLPPAGYCPYDVAQDSVVCGLWAHTAGSSPCFQLLPPSPFPQGCSQPILLPVCWCALDCCDPGAELCTLLCWTSGGSHGPTSPACHGIPSLQRVNCTHRLLSAKLLRVHSNPLSMPPTEMWNSISPSTKLLFLIPWIFILTEICHVSMKKCICVICRDLIEANC